MSLCDPLSIEVCLLNSHQNSVYGSAEKIRKMMKLPYSTKSASYCKQILFSIFPLVRSLSIPLLSFTFVNGVRHNRRTHDRSSGLLDVIGAWACRSVSLCNGVHSDCYEVHNLQSSRRIGKGYHRSFISCFGRPGTSIVHLQFPVLLTRVPYVQTCGFLIVFKVALGYEIALLYKAVECNLSNTIYRCR